TEDGKTVNYIMFFPESDSGVKVLVTDDKDATKADAEKNNSVVLGCNKISIKFVPNEEFPETEKLNGGEYGVVIGCVDNDGTNNVVTGRMKNVGGNYAKYSSSSTTPVYPLIFNAEFDKEEASTQADGNDTARMVLYSLNNQQFLIKDSRLEGDNDYRLGGTVEDNTPAVICLNSNFSHLNMGGSINFDYQVIDVLRSSPSSTRYYYILTREGAKEGSGVNFNDFEDVYDKKDNKDGIYKEVVSDKLLESDYEYYLPKNEAGENFENLNVDMAVKVFAKVVDTTSSGEESYVFFDWYLAPQHKLKINGCDFIAVGKDDEGVTYNYGGEGKVFDENNEVRQEYQKAVDEAAKNLSAGNSSYFYLPSAENLFLDNATAYKDMKISIYYYTNESSQNTSLATNNLSINVTKYGTYWFTLYATDTASNNMYYIDKDGKHVEFKTSEIGDIFKDKDKHDYLPWFKFNVNYTGAHFKDEDKPAKQSTAYVGTTYTSAQFSNIEGMSDTYKVTYRLFVFDRAGYFAAENVTFGYEDFIKEMDKLFEEHSEYFSEIKEVTESDEDYEKYKDYEWSSTSTSFVPQDGNAFYYMLAELEDNRYITEPQTYSLAIIASDEAKTLKGDSEWLQNNIASVILLSVAGVSLIAIILLLVIKPKSKEDIDVQFEQEMNKKNKAKK
nr:hypothetical protein [Clostridia bacterium]